MAKPKTLHQRARDWTNAAKPGEPAARAMRAYIAGHRAGSRLAKQERKVIEAAKYWRNSYSLEAVADLMQALDNFHAEKVRK